MSNREKGLRSNYSEYYGIRVTQTTFRNLNRLRKKLGARDVKVMIKRLYAEGGLRMVADMADISPFTVKRLMTHFGLNVGKPGPTPAPRRACN